MNRLVMNCLMPYSYIISYLWLGAVISNASEDAGSSGATDGDEDGEKNGTRMSRHGLSPKFIHHKGDTF